jgi:type II secretory pathway pseudopilin PulG
MKPEEMKNQYGQALLVVLLVMAVLGTVVLSAVSRTVTDVVVTTKEDEAIRAFSAAEAGIEKGLLSGVGGTIVSQTGDLPSGGSFAAQVSELGGSPRFKYPKPLASGESATIWFVDHDQNGNLTCSTGKCSTATYMYVCWGNLNDSPPPAVEVSIYYKDAGGIKIKREALDSDGSRRDSNKFAPASSGGDSLCNLGLGFHTIVALPNQRNSASSELGPIFARIKLLYNPNPRYVGVYTRRDSDDVNLPKQGVLVESEGQAGDARRKVVAHRLYPDLPSIFDFGVFAGSSGLTKPPE